MICVYLLLLFITMLTCCHLTSLCIESERKHDSKLFRVYCAESILMKYLNILFYKVYLFVLGVTILIRRVYSGPKVHKFCHCETFVLI